MSKVKIQGNASGTGVLTIAAPNTNTDRTITLPDSTDTLATETRVNALGGKKNLIINGDFKISQRGSYTSATSLSSTWTYYLDRFKFRLNVISGTLTHEEDQTVDSGIVDTIKLVATSTGSGYINALQMVEDTGLLKGRVVTISAWVKSDNSNAKLVVNMDGANVQFNSNLHTGGGSWELLKGTYTVPTNITTFNIYCGILANATGNVSIISGDFVEITQVQLELGSTASDFEHRSYGEELALCQRYYWKSTGESDGSYGYKAGTSFQFSFNSTGVFPTQMRSTPTTANTSGTLNACSAFSVWCNKDGYITRVTSSSGTQYRAYEQAITFDAEL